MTDMLRTDRLAARRDSLARHPVYGRIRTIDGLHAFMSHHVYAVWDFMSLLKSLQAILAPAGVPWAPLGDPAVRRFVNEIVLEEESDAGPPSADGSPRYASHFELYCEAMREVGLDPAPARRFAAHAAEEGIEAALASSDVPEAARAFVRDTFRFIETRRPHVIAAVFAWGREQVIPTMFRGLLESASITRDQAPTFHYYLDRHVSLDEDHHGPLSLRLLDGLCGGDAERCREAERAALESLDARWRMWDAVCAGRPWAVPGAVAATPE